MSQPEVGWLEFSRPLYWEHSCHGFGRKKMCFFLANINQKDLVFLKDLLEAGKVTPVVDRCYPLSDTAEALRYLEQGHAQGKVVISV
jgi:NADPH:quinone reductase-like Zn-dependent oxidoreductase